MFRSLPQRKKNRFSLCNVVNSTFWNLRKKIARNLWVYKQKLTYTAQLSIKKKSPLRFYCYFFPAVARCSLHGVFFDLIFVLFTKEIYNYCHVIQFFCPFILCSLPGISWKLLRTCVCDLALFDILSPVFYSWDIFNNEKASRISA